uniref:Uncharacterized protein n=1 Tax=Fagus sylvatica TaxID=28930 RepID=A0A2N9F0R3_FAGSY
MDGTTITPSQFIPSLTSPTILIPNLAYASRYGHLLTHELRLEQLAAVPDIGIPTANLATKTSTSALPNRQQQFSQGGRASSFHNGQGRGRPIKAIVMALPILIPTTPILGPSIKYALRPLLSSTSSNIDLVWYPDTGANNHLTADLSHLNLNDLFSRATLPSGKSKDSLYPLHSLHQIKPRALLGERVSLNQWHAQLSSSL